MANPRKFSDKLEIIRRKEEEANAAFVKIMREVSDARTGKPPHLPHHPNSWQLPVQNDYIKMRQKFKGGSLPNVNISQTPMVQNVYSLGMSEMYGGQPQPQYMNMNPPHIRRDNPSGPIFPSKNKARSYTVNTPYRNNLLHQPQPQQFLDSDSPAWRRTFSDSAIQQSLQQPPVKKSQNGMNQNHNNDRILPHQENEISSYQPSSPPSNMSLQFNETTTTKNHMQMQANTSSLPDLSNLSIPSPIQNPIDVDQDGKSNSSSREPPNPFQVPYRPAPRRVGSLGKQVYPRQSDEPKLQLNIFNNLEKPELNVPGNTVASHSAPLSPVTPPPYFWNSTPMSPLATGDLLQQVNPPSDLQQQLQQFQIQSEQSNNGMINPPPYPYAGENDNYNYFPNSNSFSPKQNVYRNNSAPLSNHIRYDRSVCDRQLDTALMKVKAQDNELSEADLNSVRVALDPLDFNDVQILNENTELVDQSAEEQFRLERASFQ